MCPSPPYLTSAHRGCFALATPLRSPSRSSCGSVLPAPLKPLRPTAFLFREAISRRAPLVNFRCLFLCPASPASDSWFSGIIALVQLIANSQKTQRREALVLGCLVAPQSRLGPYPDDHAAVGTLPSTAPAHHLLRRACHGKT